MRVSIQGSNLGYPGAGHEDLLTPGEASPKQHQESCWQACAYHACTLGLSPSDISAGMTCSGWLALPAECLLYETTAHGIANACIAEANKFGIIIFFNNRLTSNAGQASRRLEDRGSTTQALYICTMQLADLGSYT